MTIPSRSHQSTFALASVSLHFVLFIYLFLTLFLSSVRSQFISFECVVVRSSIHQCVCSEIIACRMLPCIDMCSSFICFFLAISLCRSHFVISLVSSFTLVGAIVYSETLIVWAPSTAYFYIKIVNIYRTIVCRVLVDSMPWGARVRVFLAHWE